MNKYNVKIKNAELCFRLVQAEIEPKEGQHHEPLRKSWYLPYDKPGINKHVCFQRLTDIEVIESFWVQVN